MTLSERLARTDSDRQHRQAKAQAQNRAILDSIAPMWSADATNTVRCAHCGESLDYSQTVWAQAHGGIWYALCSDRAACGLRAHGHLN
jgi:hypothetical protein